MVKLIMAFGVGLGIGAVGSYIWYRKKLDELDEEVEFLNNDISKLSKEINRINNAEKESAHDVDFKVVEEPSRQTVNPTAEEETEEVLEAGQIIIDETAFSEEHDEFDKIDLWYYVKDDMLVDETENEVSVKSSIAKVSYLLDSVVGDEVYIRNFENETDFHVIVVDDSFYPDDY